MEPNIDKQEVNADNFPLLINYALLLQYQDKAVAAQTLLLNIADFLAKNTTTELQSQIMAQAEVQAMLKNKVAALNYFEQALNKGWLTDFNHEWWSIEDNIRLSFINKEPEFLRLVTLSRLRLKKIRKRFGI